MNGHLKEPCQEGREGSEFDCSWGGALHNLPLRFVLGAFTIVLCIPENKHNPEGQKDRIGNGEWLCGFPGCLHDCAL